MRYLLIFLALAVGIGDDGVRQGRKGNEMYRNEKHAEAARWFGEGLQAVTEPRPGPVQAGLWNNLGASLYRMGDYEQATQAFSNAVAMASSEQEVARSAYNAGNNAFKAAAQANQGAAAPPPSANESVNTKGQTMEAALEHYKQAMLADPANEDAKYNYEFVKRKLQEQQQQDQQQQQDNQDQQNNDDQQQQDQQQQQEQQEQQQDQQQQNQQQDQQQQDQQQQDQQQQQTPEDLDKLSQEEAERILQALQNEEEELLRQIVKPQTKPKKVDKDW